VVLDKTGTLTYGEPEVIYVRPLDGTTEKDVIEAAAIAERPSEHPLAKAILRKASEASLRVVEPSRFTYLPGKGLVCCIDREEIVVGNRALFEEYSISVNGFVSSSEHSSEILVARGGHVLGTIQVADRLRPEAINAVAELQ